jgi:hypothetical protein
MQDLGQKTEVSLDDFIKTFVPNFPKYFEISDVLRHMDQIKAWNAFSSPPATNKRHEDAVFNQLKRLFDEMVKAAQQVWKQKAPGSNKEQKKTCPKPRWILITDPTATLTTPERPSTIKAFFHHNEDSDPKPYQYHNIAFTGEFKKQGGPANSFDVSPPCIFAHPSS